MTTAARNLLTTFETLTPDEQRDVTEAILRLAPRHEELNDQDFDGVATELFSAYDAEESTNATPTG